MTGCTVEQEWNSKLLNLHLDHKDGDSTNCLLSNLRFLCPNCHSQTDTYTARNSNAYKNAETTYCARCGETSKSGNYCRACEPYVVLDFDTIIVPSLAQLQREVEAANINYIACKYRLDKTTLVKVLNNLDKYSEYPLRRRVALPSLEDINLAIRDNQPESLKELASLLKIEPGLFYKFAMRNKITLPPRIKEAPLSPVTSKEFKTAWPSIEEILLRINAEGYETLARKLNVSSNAIRKHLKVRTGSYPKTMTRKRA